MNIIQLKRSYNDSCTIGKMHFGGMFICYTVELPWRSNEPFKSCIPAGFYILEQFNPKESTPKKEYDKAKHKDCFYLENKNLGVSLVGNTTRTGILIHVANFTEDIVGCIGPGLTLHPTRWGVANSKRAMKKLNDLITHERDWGLNIT